VTAPHPSGWGLYAVLYFLVDLKKSHNHIVVVSKSNNAIAKPCQTRSNTVAKIKSFSKSARIAHGASAIVTFGGAVGGAYGARHFFERAITNAVENNAPAAAGSCRQLLRRPALHEGCF